MTTKTTDPLPPIAASPHRSVDASGRVLPRTEEEIRARNEVARQALAANRADTDATDTDEMFERFIREIDEDREPGSGKRYR